MSYPDGTNEKRCFVCGQILGKTKAGIYFCANCGGSLFKLGGKQTRFDDFMPITDTR